MSGDIWGNVWKSILLELYLRCVRVYIQWCRDQRDESRNIARCFSYLSIPGPLYTCVSVGTSPRQDATVNLIFAIT